MRRPPASPPTKLSKAALAFRTFHAAIAFEQLLAIAYVWWCAATGRRGRLLRIAAVSLIGEGVLVAANRGDCPLGPLQERLGDTVPLFELVLSPRAAKRAVPTLGAVAAGGLLLLMVRVRRDAGVLPRGARGGGMVGPVLWPNLTGKMVHDYQARRAYARYFERS